MIILFLEKLEIVSFEKKKKKLNIVLRSENML